MKADVPKQFLVLAGLPVLMHSIRLFHRFDPSLDLIVALPEKDFSYWKELCRTYEFTLPHRLAKGGATRFHSVRNSLDLVTGEGLVAIHDAVRPLVSQETLKRVFEEAGKNGNAIPVIPVNESIREMAADKSREVNRENLRIVQTPQVFRKELIKKAYQLAPHSDFTDDATVLETLGETIHLVDGDAENIKITRRMDLLVAEMLLTGSVKRE
jgi:2-C-methyl-D-erythritol 4-phosphate cytidylyltransferase